VIQGGHQLFMLIPYNDLSAAEGHAHPDSTRNVLLGGDMACKVCASDNQQKFPGEMNVGFPGINRVSLPSIYVSAALLVCLHCGYTEIVIPATQLERLKEGIDTVRSAGA
jgi:hypothetical protein